MDGWGTWPWVTIDTVLKLFIAFITTSYVLALKFTLIVYSFIL